MGVSRELIQFVNDHPFADHPTAVYAYRLEGSDHEWHYLDKGNLDISYNGLSYGDYHACRKRTISCRS